MSEPVPTPAEEQPAEQPTEQAEAPAVEQPAEQAVEGPAAPAAPAPPVPTPPLTVGDKSDLVAKVMRRHRGIPSYEAWAMTDADLTKLLED